jgi:hypothetical protein
MTFLCGIRTRRNIGAAVIASLPLLVAGQSVRADTSLRTQRFSESTATAAPICGATDQPAVLSTATKWYFSPTGDDVNGTGSTLSPWKIPQKHWVSYKSGDAIVLKNGTWDLENVSLLDYRTSYMPVNGATIANLNTLTNLTIMAETRWGAIVRKKHPVLPAVATDYGNAINGLTVAPGTPSPTAPSKIDGLTIWGIQFEDWYDTSGNAVIGFGGDVQNIKMIANRFRNNGNTPFNLGGDHTITMSTNTWSRIRNFEIAYNWFESQKGGTAVDMGAHNLAATNAPVLGKIHHNRFTGAMGEGIYVEAGYQGIQAQIDIFNNTFHGTYSDAAIRFAYFSASTKRYGADSTLKIRNNIFDVAGYALENYGPMKDLNGVQIVEAIHSPTITNNTYLVAQPYLRDTGFTPPLSATNNNRDPLLDPNDVPLNPDETLSVEPVTPSEGFGNCGTPGTPVRGAWQNTNGALVTSPAPSFCSTGGLSYSATRSGPVLSVGSYGYFEFKNLTTNTVSTATTSAPLPVTFGGTGSGFLPGRYSIQAIIVSGTQLTKSRLIFGVVSSTCTDPAPVLAAPSSGFCITNGAFGYSATSSVTAFPNGTYAFFEFTNIATQQTFTTTLAPPFMPTSTPPGITFGGTTSGFDAGSYAVQAFIVEPTTPLRIRQSNRVVGTMNPWCP